MFRTLLCPSSGAREYVVDNHIGNQEHSRELLMMGIVMSKTC